MAGSCQLRAKHNSLPPAGMSVPESLTSVKPLLFYYVEEETECISLYEGWFQTMLCSWSLLIDLLQLSKLALSRSISDPHYAPLVIIM